MQPLVTWVLVAALGLVLVVLGWLVVSLKRTTRTINRKLDELIRTRSTNRFAEEFAAWRTKHESAITAEAAKDPNSDEYRMNRELEIYAGELAREMDELESK